MNPAGPARSLRSNVVSRARHFGRVLLYVWASPATLVGLIVSIIPLCAGAKICPVAGVIEIACEPIARAKALLPASLPFVAITFGHVVIGVDRPTLHRVRCHEHAHVRQYERWGAFFFFLYLGSSLIELIRGRDPYFDNCFEVEARALAEANEFRGQR